MTSYNRKQGPSGELQQHFIECSSRAEARNRAKEASNHHKAPIHHTAHEPGQKPHYHPVDANGEIKKNGQHFTYPESK